MANNLTPINVNHVCLYPLHRYSKSRLPNQCCLFWKLVCIFLWYRWRRKIWGKYENFITLTATPGKATKSKHFSPRKWKNKERTLKLFTQTAPSFCSTNKMEKGFPMPGFKIGWYVNYFTSLTELTSFSCQCKSPPTSMGVLVDFGILGQFLESWS